MYNLIQKERELFYKGIELKDLIPLSNNYKLSKEKEEVWKKQRFYKNMIKRLKENKKEVLGE